MIIITTPVHPIMLDIFSKKDIEYTYAPNLNYNGLMDIISNATGLIVSTQIKIDKQLIDKANKIKWIGRLGSGMEHIDVKYATSKNINCESSPEGNKIAVAEHALGLLLSLMRHSFKSANEVKSGIWLREENRGEELSGKRIGIIGFGNTGSSFARLLSSFDVTILAYDKYKSGFGNNYIKEATLEEIIEQSNVISFHLPLTNETENLADGIFFNKLGKVPYIINTSRGGIINTADLITALRNEKIKGVALDVLENEQLSTYTQEEKDYFNYLTTQKNVIITPHIAGYSFEASYKLCVVLLEKLGIT